MKIPKGSIVSFRTGEREVYIWLTLKDMNVKKEDVLVCANIKEAYPDLDNNVLKTCELHSEK